MTTQHAVIVGIALALLLTITVNLDRIGDVLDESGSEPCVIELDPKLPGPEPGRPGA